MARRNGNLISGVLGSLVFSVVNGKQYVRQRSAPGTMKQTAEMKRASNAFGLASSLAAKFSGTVKEQLLGIPPQDVRNRLNGQLAQILSNCRVSKTNRYHFDMDSFAALDDFEYNSKSLVAKLLFDTPEITLAKNQIKVALPALAIPSQLKFPNKAFQCKVNVNVSLLRLRDGLYQPLAAMQTVVFNKNMAKTEAHEFEFSIPNGCLCIVSLFLVYEIADRKGFKPINSKNFNPGCICKAFITGGDYQGGDGIVWKEMKKFP